MLKIPFLLFVAFILTGGLQAQEPELFVEVRFLFLDESGGRYAVQQEETFQLISSYPYAISSPVTRPVGETL
ncbi:MAG: hypothetical protein PF795_06490, partial [Kiritimatiellae bacterium]|nr:hypothetical protein [Kiritimatiellia bacterium]